MPHTTSLTNAAIAGTPFTLELCGFCVDGWANMRSRGCCVRYSNSAFLASQGDDEIVRPFWASVELSADALHTSQEHRSLDLPVLPPGASRGWCVPE